MELQHLGVLIKNVSSSSIQLIATELVIDLDDVSQFVGEIILRRKTQISIHPSHQGRQAN